MSRFFIELSFKGTRYFGWQIQPGKPTVQETLETVFSTFLREQIAITGAHGKTSTTAMVAASVNGDITNDFRATMGMPVTERR